jgi:hypothetical protein
MFGISLTSLYGTNETLDFQTYLNGDEVAKTCAGPVNSTHCYLQSAIAEYDVQILHNTVNLVDPANPRFISWANNTAMNNVSIDKFGLREAQSGWIKTTLGGIVNTFVFQYAFTGHKSSKTQNDSSVTIGIDGQQWFIHQEASNYAQYNNGRACAFTWKDPRTAVMAGLNELMFRIGVHAAQNHDHASLLLDPGVQINYTSTGFEQDQQVVFKSDFTFYYPAAALQIVTIVVTALTFWKYWNIDRPVSFSPLEMTKVTWPSQCTFLADSWTRRHWLDLG